jgi:adenine-specific DNA-methyltransferase
MQEQTSLFPARRFNGRRTPRIELVFQHSADAVLYTGDCRQFLSSLPDGIARLVITSPPYNIGKRYEFRMDFDKYLDEQSRVIQECVRVLAEDGSICWQVGNFVHKNEIVPLDVALWPTFKRLGLKLRNRVIWHFEHGLHCSRRFSGRYETIVWLTKSDQYVFNLDAVRVPQKYPGKKHFKGPKQGQFSSNPLGKNPGDVWIIPNVKHNHVEKTLHPCQFPVELVERLTLALTNPGDWVLDPYMGVGTAPAAALRQGRKGMGSEIVVEYVELARKRVLAAYQGTLRTRPMNRPVHKPSVTERVAQNPFAGSKR